MKYPIYKKIVTENQCKSCLFYRKKKCGLGYWIKWNKKGIFNYDK